MYRFSWLLLAVMFVMGCGETTPKEAAVGEKAPPAPRKDVGEKDSSEKNMPKTPVIGEMAPEITGIDLDGVEFKLSDYRGKVVLLDFWGDW